MVKLPLLPGRAVLAQQARVLAQFPAPVVEFSSPELRGSLPGLLKYGVLFTV